MRSLFSAVILVAFTWAHAWADDLSDIRARAEAGDPAAQFELGQHYDNKGDKKKDLRRAIDWYSKAAQDDFARAQFQLGRMYVLGRGVAQDEALGIEWQIKAAEQGFAEAQYAVGRRYLFGIALDRDYDKALNLITAAANQGITGAQNQLGSMYFQGQGVSKDLVQSYKWFSIAARADDPSAGRYLTVLESVMEESEVKAAKELTAQWQVEGTSE